jgi:hypothetical protein
MGLGVRLQPHFLTGGAMFLDKIRSQFVVTSNAESQPGSLSFDLTIPLGDLTKFTGASQEMFDEALEVTKNQKWLSDMLWKELRGEVSNDAVTLEITGIETEVLQTPRVTELANPSVLVRVTLHYEMRAYPTQHYVETLLKTCCDVWINPKTFDVEDEG